MSFDTMFEHTHCSMQSIKPIPLYIQLNSEVIVVISRMDGMDLDQIQMLSLKDLQGFTKAPGSCGTLNTMRIRFFSPTATLCFLGAIRKNVVMAS